MLSFEFVYLSEISFNVFILSFIPASLVTAILLVNNIRDIDMDRKADIKTLPMVIGIRNAKYLYTTLILFPYLFVFYLIKTGILEKKSLFIYLTLFITIRLLYNIYKGNISKADKETAFLHFIAGMLFNIMKENFSKICKVLLEELEEKIKNILSSMNKETEIVLKFINNSGKNMRSAFFLCLFEDCNIKINSDILKIAFSLELLHCAALIQDDVFDNSQNRRKIKSLHKQFEQNNNTNGKSIAVLFSNIIISYVYEIITELEIDEKLKNLIISNISDAIIRTSIGEICDVKNDSGYLNDLEDILRFYDLKTGFYTFILPFRLFNLFYKIQNIKEIEKKFYLYARIFQIKNDINDFTSGRYEDLTQNKITSVTFFMLEHEKNNKESIKKDIKKITKILNNIIEDINSQIQSIDKKNSFQQTISKNSQNTEKYII